MVSSPSFTSAWPRAIPISTLTLDIHGRAALDQSVVMGYAAAMRAHVVFPAADVLELDGTLYVVDGHHRVAAAKMVGEAFYNCRIVPVASRRDVVFGAALAHARDMRDGEEPLRYADKRHVITLALSVRPEGMSDALMSRLLHVRRTLVTEMRLSLGIAAFGFYSHDRRARDHAKRASIAERIRRGEFAKHIVEAEGTSYSMVAQVRKLIRQELAANGVPVPATKAKQAVEARRAKILEMVADGSFTPEQIAEKVGVDRATVNAYIRTKGIRNQIRHRGGHRRLNPDRIVSRMAEDAVNLTADVRLIDFDDLDRTKVDAWLGEFKRARRALTVFMERLAQVKGESDGDSNGRGV